VERWVTLASRVTEAVVAPRITCYANPASKQKKIRWLTPSLANAQAVWSDTKNSGLGAIFVGSTLPGSGVIFVDYTSFPLRPENFTMTFLRVVSCSGLLDAHVATERGQHGDGTAMTSCRANGTKHDHWLPGTGPDVMITALTVAFVLEIAPPGLACGNARGHARNSSTRTNRL
jgi:hypothetical protein